MLADLVPDYTQFAKDLSMFEDLAGSFSGTNGLLEEFAATQKMLADLVPDYTQFAKDLSTFEDLAGSFSGTNRLLEEFAAAQAFEPPTLYDPSYYVLPPPPPRFEVRPPRFDVLDEPEPLPKRTIVRPEVKRKPGFQRW
jgi:hypothetical protein